MVSLMALVAKITVLLPHLKPNDYIYNEARGGSTTAIVAAVHEVEGKTYASVAL